MNFYHVGDRTIVRPIYNSKCCCYFCEEYFKKVIIPYEQRQYVLRNEDRGTFFYDRVFLNMYSCLRHPPIIEED